MRIRFATTAIISLLSLCAIGVSGCATEKSAAKGKSAKEQRIDRLDEIVDGSFENIPQFPSESDDARQRDLNTLKKRLAGCQTKDGIQLLCPGVLLWIYSGNVFDLEMQKVGRYGDVGGATTKTEQSLDEQFRKFSAKFAGADETHVVMTKMTGPTATVSCQVRAPYGQSLCTALLTATAQFGREEVGRVVAGNVDLMATSLVIPSRCIRKDAPGRVDITCSEGVKLQIGRAPTNTSEMGMRVLAANFAERFERAAQAEGASTDRDEAKDCLLDGRRGECLVVRAALGPNQHVSTFAVASKSHLFAKCSQPDGDAMPDVCAQLITLPNAPEPTVDDTPPE